MSDAEDLILAVQAGDPDKQQSLIRAKVVETIAATKKLTTPYERNKALWTVLNGTVHGGVTALHVACRMYVLGTTERAKWDRMIEMLLNAGACPFLAMGAVYKSSGGQRVMTDPGQTCFQICRGEVPPSLSAWLISQKTYTPHDFPEKHASRHAKSCAA